MLLANFTLRGELKFGMPASPIGSRLRRVAVPPLREGKQCEKSQSLWERAVLFNHPCRRSGWQSPSCETGLCLPLL